MKEQLLLLGPSPPSLGFPSGKAPGITVQEGARRPTGNLHFPLAPEPSCPERRQEVLLPFLMAEESRCRMPPAGSTEFLPRPKF